MVLEDAHWADPTTLELLGLAVDRMRAPPVLLLVTIRPEFAPPWAGHGRTSPRLTLDRLGRGETAAIVARRVAGGRALPPERAGRDRWPGPTGCRCSSRS